MTDVVTTRDSMTKLNVRQDASEAVGMETASMTKVIMRNDGNVAANRKHKSRDICSHDEGTK